MKRVINMNPRHNEYDAYLEQHITGVQRAWHEILEPALTDNIDVIDITVEDFSTIDELVRRHDESKYQSDEYGAYCNYFYPCEGFEKDQEAFDLAWLRHIHANPHHHQHWVLVRDEGELVPMDMPIPYICEMLCDWHSFTLRDPESTAYKWWQDNQHKMTLSDNTIEVIEAIIGFMKEPLSKPEE